VDYHYPPPPYYRQGPNHGVYVVGGDGRVEVYLQKAPLSELQSRGAILPEQQVLIDTGVCYFSPAATHVRSEQSL